MEYAQIVLYCLLLVIVWGRPEPKAQSVLFISDVAGLIVTTVFLQQWSLLVTLSVVEVLALAFTWFYVFKTS